MRKPKKFIPVFGGVGINLPGGTQITSPLGLAHSSLGGTVSLLVTYLLPGAGLLMLLYLIFGGFQYMLSGGDPKAVQAAKGKITGAIVGFIIVFLAYWIVQAVAIILGISSIQQTFVGLVGGGGGCGTAGTTRCVNGLLEVCDGSTWRPTGQICP